MKNQIDLTVNFYNNQRPIVIPVIANNQKQVDREIKKIYRRGSIEITRGELSISYPIASVSSITNKTII